MSAPDPPAKTASTCTQPSCKSITDCLAWLDREEDDNQVDSGCLCRSIKSMIINLRRRQDNTLSDRFFQTISIILEGKQGKFGSLDNLHERALPELGK